MESQNDSHLCRLCLQDEQYLIYIFQEHPVQTYVPAVVIQDLLQIQVSETDGYPPFACLGCFDKLSDIQNFKNQCLGSIKAYENLLTLKASCESEPREMQGLLAVMKQELEDETNEYESNEDPLATVKQELEQSGDEGECNEDALAMVKQESEESGEECDEVSGNDIGVLDTALAMRMLRSQLQISPLQMEEAAVGVLRREEIPKRVTFGPYLGSSASKSNINDYGVVPRINVPGYHVGTRASGKRNFKAIRDNKSPSNEGMNVQELEKGVRGERFTSTKCSESHRKRSRRSSDEDLCTRNNNRGDKSPPKRPEYVSRAEGTSKILIERCVAGLPQSVRGECLEKGERERGGEVEGVEGRGREVKREGRRRTASEKGVGGKKERYECSHCESVLTNKGSVVRHMARHGLGKYNHCDVCDKMFGNKGELVRHSRIHTGEKPFKCSVCSMCFSQHNNLNIHMRTHTGEKPYKCDTCCKTFTRSSNLIRHSRVHTGEKPHHCHKCFKRFNDKSCLNRHVRSCCTQGKLGSE